MGSRRTSDSAIGGSLLRVGEGVGQGARAYGARDLDDLEKGGRELLVLKRLTLIKARYSSKITLLYTKNRVGG